MQICTNMSWLRHYQGRITLFWGVTYITWCYTLTLSLSEGSHLLFCVLYNVVLENYSVQNSLWGRGVYSQLKTYMGCEKTITDAIKFSYNFFIILCSNRFFLEFPPRFFAFCTSSMKITI